jgi:hypothetical protein
VLVWLLSRTGSSKSRHPLLSSRSVALLHRCILVLPSFSPLATSSARPAHHVGVSKKINQLCFLPSGRVVLPTARNSLPCLTRVRLFRNIRGHR